MNAKYKRKKTSVTVLRYHIIFCPYKRRKIFDIPGVEKDFKEIVRSIVSSIGIEIIAMECHHDHVHLFVSADPDIAPSEIVRRIKGNSSIQLRQKYFELAHGSHLWTRSYFIATAGDASAETIQHYVEAQKSR